LGISCPHGDPTLRALRYRAVSTSTESVANAISADTMRSCSQKQHRLLRIPHHV
jgi:hypothetical protein